MAETKGVTLVTGAAQGLGRCIALRLADDGFAVAVNDVPARTEALATLVAEIEAKGRRSSVHVADVAQEVEVRAMVAAVVTRHGGLDVVRLSAAYAGLVPAEEWDRVMTTNARGTFLCYKYAAMQMILQGRGGSIIGASSIAGKQGMLLQGPYSASKFAIRGLTQAAALEFGPHGIRVNAYAPGAIDTPMLNAASVTVPEDIANIVSFLASKESGFITGISVNGGFLFD
ncbi:hypothetical protein GGX14DRAFT_532642 [Mycena pura]|uniref:NAD(P)-binding protein n=1 Tax=Mycena pura TaxID=153505 RepID=A0AAD6YGW0_9AGAR|nr:hypothetical protein GGX14DRAFT_532642 [Mycena pura]